MLFEDCISWTWCYGFKVGQGGYTDQKNVTFNGTVVESAVGLGVHHKYGTGIFENITFEDIDIEKVNCQNDDNRSWFMLQIMGGAKGHGPIHNVIVRDITVRDKGTTRGKILGLTNESMATDVKFENIKLLGNEKPATTLAQMNVTNRDFYEDAFVLNGTPSEIQAAYFNTSSNITINEDTTIIDSTGGGNHIEGKNGSWAKYEEVDFGTGIETIALRLNLINTNTSTYRYVYERSNRNITSRTNTPT